MWRTITNNFRAILSEADGTPSSTRCLMYIFSVFAMCLLWRCFDHIFQLRDQTLITIWLSNMPLLITSLIGLIALPYGINKGTATFSDIATIMSSARTNNVNTAITGTFSDLKNMVLKSPAPPDESAPVPMEIPPAITGSSGVKG